MRGQGKSFAPLSCKCHGFLLNMISENYLIYETFVNNLLINNDR